MLALLRDNHTIIKESEHCTVIQSVGQRIQLSSK